MNWLVCSIIHYWYIKIMLSIHWFIIEWIGNKFGAGKRVYATLGLWWRGGVSAASAGWRWHSAVAAQAARRRLNLVNICRLLHHLARPLRRLPRGNNTPGRRPRSERLASLATVFSYSLTTELFVLPYKLLIKIVSSQNKKKSFNVFF